MAEDQNNWTLWWRDLGRRDRWIVAAVGLAIVVGAGAALYWTLKPKDTVLFSGLEPGVATRIANQLTLDGIPNVADEAGGKVLVPKDQVYQSRIRVMERGMPTTGPVGFELFDTAEFGVTDFAQRINYQRALEGELSRTILALEEIDQVRLHLVLPEPGLFHRDDEAPKASLTVGVKPSEHLSPVRVRALQRLVAAAVPGLEPDAVAIIDLQGNPLHEPASEEEAVSGGGSGTLESQRALETYLTQKAQAALDATVGAGMASVVVNADLEHGQRQRHRESVLPVGAGITGAVKSLRSWGRGTPTELLAPAQVAENPGEEIARAPAPGRDMGTEVQYEVGHEVEDLKSAGPQIRRLTVSVIAPTALADEQFTALADVVAKAVGIDEARGDRVAVHRTPIPESSRRASLVQAATGSHGPDVVRQAVEVRDIPVRIYAVWIVVLVVVGLMAWKLGRRERPGAMSKPELEKLLQEIRVWLAREPTSHTKPSDG